MIGISLGLGGIGRPCIDIDMPEAGWFARLTSKKLRRLLAELEEIYPDGPPFGRLDVDPVTLLAESGAWRRYGHAENAETCHRYAIFRTPTDVRPTMVTFPGGDSVWLFDLRFLEAGVWQEPKGHYDKRILSGFTIVPADEIYEACSVLRGYGFTLAPRGIDAILDLGGVR